MNEPSIRMAKGQRMARAQWLMAERHVEATGHLRGQRRYEEAFESAVKAEVRRIQKRLSRWRSTIPTYVKQRPAPPRRQFLRINAKHLVWAPIRQLEGDDET